MNDRLIQSQSITLNNTSNCLDQAQKLSLNGSTLCFKKRPSFETVSGLKDEK